MAQRFRMRGNKVLIRKEKRGLLGRIHMPEKSAEGVNFFVQEVGPNVAKDLKPGDQVMIMGKADQPFYPVPGEPNLIVVTEDLVAYVIETVSDDDSPTESV